MSVSISEPERSGWGPRAFFKDPRQEMVLRVQCEFGASAGFPEPGPGPGSGSDSGSGPGA